MADDQRSGRAGRVAQRWARAYTAGLPHTVRTRRLAEIESDLFEQSRRPARRRRDRSGFVILVRTVRSVPLDLLWRVEARRERPMTQTGSTTVAARSGRTRPRSPGAVYAMLTLAMIVLVGSLALTRRQTPPPTIAEFAPQAVEQISESTGDTTRASAGAAENQLSAGDAAANQPGRTAAVDVARARRCVGDPPRQIEDPQSPPCVPYWSGDNGGSTWRGVTRDEIRVSDTWGPWAWSEALATFFNRRFEFYGRRIRLIPRRVTDGPAGERASARAAYEQDQSFASNTSVCDTCHVYFDELGRLGIVAAARSMISAESHLASRRPYLWTYPMANDRMFAIVGNWFCARFAGRNSVHAGDPFLQTSRRKLGVILFNAGLAGTSTEPIRAQLAPCGERERAVFLEQGQAYDVDAVANQAFMENSLLQMKAAGVTTVVCLCMSEYIEHATRGATKQGYFPEWVMTDYLSNADSGWFFGTKEQMKSMMMLASVPMERPWQDHPSAWAASEAGMANENPGDIFKVTDITYRMMLLLASGFQMAGPDLTPQTFERGLHQARFPNPAHRIMAGAVGFGDGDHSMTNDVAEMWWSNTARGPYANRGVGAFCYVDHGARRRLGEFPTDDPFFSGECDAGTS